MMRIEQVDFVSVPTRDYASAVAWYRDVLGVPLAFNEEECNNWYTIYRARDEAGKEFGVVFAIFKAEKPLGTERRQARVNWRVKDLEAMVRQMKEKGVEVERREEYSYGVFAWVRDPEGNSVEVWEAIGG